MVSLADLSMPTVSSPLTMKGTILGTLQYMAPEQLEGKEVDARADIFAFGGMLYEMLTGRRPFEGKSQASLIGAILDHQPPPVTTYQPVSPPILDDIVARCLAKDPDERWQSARDLKRQLEWVAGQLDRCRRAMTSAAVAPPRVGTRGVDCSLRLWPAAAIAAAVRMGALARSGAARLVVTRFRVDLPDGQGFTRPGRHVLALSPDGSRAGVRRESAALLARDERPGRDGPAGNRRDRIPRSRSFRRTVNGWRSGRMNAVRKVADHRRHAGDACRGAELRSAPHGSAIAFCLGKPRRAALWKSPQLVELRNCWSASTKPRAKSRMARSCSRGGRAVLFTLQNGSGSVGRFGHRHSGTGDAGSGRFWPTAARCARVCQPAIWCTPATRRCLRCRLTLTRLIATGGSGAGPGTASNNRRRRPERSGSGRLVGARHVRVSCPARARARSARSSGSTGRARRSFHPRRIDRMSSRIGVACIARRVAGGAGDSPRLRKHARGGRGVDGLVPSPTSGCGTSPEGP